MIHTTTMTVAALSTLSHTIWKTGITSGIPASVAAHMVGPSASVPPHRVFRSPAGVLAAPSHSYVMARPTATAGRFRHSPVDPPRRLAHDKRACTPPSDKGTADE